MWISLVFVSRSAIIRHNQKTEKGRPVRYKFKLPVVNGQVLDVNGQLNMLKYYVRIYMPGRYVKLCFNGPRAGLDNRDKIAQQNWCLKRNATEARVYIY